MASCSLSRLSGCCYDRWIDYKYGKPLKRSDCAWVKAHIVSGRRTNVVPHIRILEQDANDSPQLNPLLETTAKWFTIQEVSADVANSSHANPWTIDLLGAASLVQFKKNAVATKKADGGSHARSHTLVRIRALFLSPTLARGCELTPVLASVQENICGLYGVRRAVSIATGRDSRGDQNPNRTT